MTSVFYFFNFGMDRSGIVCNLDMCTLAVVEIIIRCILRAKRLENASYYRYKGTETKKDLLLKCFKSF